MDDQLSRLTNKKHRLDALQPIPPELARDLDEWFKIELTYNTATPLKATR